VPDFQAPGSSKLYGVAGVLSVGGVSLLAVGVNETGFEHVRCAGFPVGCEMVSRERLAGHLQPLFPLLGVLWLMVGVEQEFPAERTAALLRL
jgi:hypothetical protein